MPRERSTPADEDRQVKIQMAKVKWQKPPSRRTFAICLLRFAI
jgi:hypothetical protein